MFEYQSGDLLKSDAHALVNPVNCVGVMGKGLALQFKKAWPQNYRQYRQACQDQTLAPGIPFIYQTANAQTPRYIVNFPTKRHWRNPSRLDDIVAGLESLNRIIISETISSVAIPPLGCGLGGLKWTPVHDAIVSILEPASRNARIIIYPP